ncbi:MAG: segregation/condensation protein A [Armatimonadota bacterium]|nr:segregation/condensation protein A [Armatimonadota bacterium]MDR7450355.1 segregation/condensation protein A [Armatimonadota bacterium]MDR7467062.1 segregation/condensation protein A [Armatimonadota bacterium]MDR7493396.1 segregation/condensation protein A [Armatimonadota bacterium]MDR7499404.1 segregation/condensation protein A [Armatimonadota bacterium]
MPGYTVTLPQFTGPLELLLTLAQQGQVDLREIPLGQIAEDYIAASGAAIDLEEATEVLWMLAAMIEMKSRLLVPKDEAPVEPLETEAPPSDLEERLEGQLQEYRAFKEVTTALRALEEYQRKVFARPREGEAGEVLLEGVTVDDLFRAFQQVLERAREQVGEIPAEEIKVADRMDAILDRLAQRPDGVAFAELFGERAGTLEVIVTFLALLELIKQRRVRVQQPRPFAPIRLALVTP